ncbi:MAG: hypothetical protein GY856_25620 [bacterium]|nr:hypothetical protein [bacterium]
MHLMNPSEKYWGVLESLAVPGLTLRGINLSSFDDWTRSIACEENPTMGLSTVFFPMPRVERMFLDEQVGEVESLCQRFERRVGMAVEEYLGPAG